MTRIPNRGASAQEHPSRTPPPATPDVATDTWSHSRRYGVYRGNTLLGTSNLEFPVVPHERIAGRFVPAAACAHVSWVFDLYATAVAAGDRRMLKGYVAERDSLRLQIWDAGVRINATVDLISTWSDGTQVLHVTSTDNRLWQSRLLPD